MMVGFESKRVNVVAALTLRPAELSDPVVACQQRKAALL